LRRNEIRASWCANIALFFILLTNQFFVIKKIFHWVLVLVVFSSCSSTRNASGVKDDGKIEVVFVQINDVYEIAPLSGGKEGGVARIATLKKKYLQQNPNCFLVIAGDFVSPSVYNSLQYNGKAIRGKQMIEALNAAGMDFAVFGNHEFDIKESELQERIDESHFQWVSSNAFHHVGNTSVPFARTGGATIPKTFIMNVRDADGTNARIGFIGLCLPFNKADYVTYTDPLASAKEVYNQIKDSVDAVVAITHQAIEDDEILAKEIPGLAMIIGGHEHDQRFKKTGKIYITKALANAKSAYVLKLRINKKKKKSKVEPTLEIVNETIPLDSATNVVVEKWTSIAEKNYSSLGFDAMNVLIKNGSALDGREAEVRSHPTTLTQLITASMADAVPNADVVLVNAGSIRVDDILHPPLTEYDIIRTLPFGGGIREADMKGSLLIRALEQGKKNAGIGGYLLHNDNLVNDTSGRWILNGTQLIPEKIYHVAIGEFLFTGKEANLDFLSPSNPEVVKTYNADTITGSSKADIRLAVIRYLKKKQ
jgi:2',3'-cyclic-nucleotide 2'-phosphodiesterase (5'-nucleotidase family)